MTVVIKRGESYFFEEIAGEVDTLMGHITMAKNEYNLSPEKLHKLINAKLDMCRLSMLDALVQKGVLKLEDMK